MIHPTHGNEEEDEEEEEDGEKEEEEKARCEWDFHLCTSVISSSSAGGAISDTLGVIEFDPSDRLLATGGIARKIRIYSLSSLLPHDLDHIGQGLDLPTTLLEHSNACDYYICTPAKLSSLRWRPDSASRVVGSGDYDGVVTEYDLEQRVAVFERDEHGGRRVWSVDYSRRSPPLGASGSDDGSAHLWDPRSGGGACVGKMRPGAPVCCVEFDPFGGALVAIGSADRLAYAYDIRNMAAPVSIFRGHRKTVSYVRFAAEGCLLSAGIDGRLKLWNTTAGGIVRTYKGHVNSRRFVGLSVWRNGGLFGCGSENNNVFVYDKRWGEPIWVRGLEPKDDQRFVSSVCWRQAGENECTLVAGGSDGVLQVFLGTKTSFPAC